jgi:hypothetical protein
MEIIERQLTYGAGCRSSSWHNLSTGAWVTSFTASKGSFPKGLLRFSISSIPYPSHLNVTIGGVNVPFSLFPESVGSRDRAWVEVHLKDGLKGLTRREAGERMEVNVQLTKEGWEAEVGQGGKMLTSLEILEYGPDTR